MAKPTIAPSVRSLIVLRNALTAAAAEMDVTMWRTSRSTIVREMLDYSTAIFDADGNNVAQSARIPQHLNSMGYFLQTILDRFIPVDLWEEGDVIISNDPYCGGQHLPDIAAFRPVFSEGRRVAIVEEDYTAVYVAPGWSLTRGRDGHLVAVNNEELA